jgi:oxygen-independent coproporphyrinogen III oxidase
VERVIAELRTAEWPFRPETVYFGGGTPSRMDHSSLSSMLAAVPGAPWAEATLEAAPGGLDAARVRTWRELGISRVSLGVQSFVARELSRTGRKHNAEIVQREVAHLRECGLVNFNIDLIAGLPGQTEASWRESLDWVERLDAPHVSVYMLEVDDDSRLGAEILAFGKRYGALDVPSEDQIAEFYEIAVERLAAMGIARYEISNFARPGFESRHNLKYWRREAYLGFGADAHSLDGRWRWQNVESAKEYVERAGSPAADRTLADDVGEPYFLGLRLAEGILRVPGPFEAAIERFVREGLLEEVAGRVRLTSRGVLLSNEVFAEFVGPGFQPAAGLLPGEDGFDTDDQRRAEAPRQAESLAPQ